MYHIPYIYHMVHNLYANLPCANRRGNRLQNMCTLIFHDVQIVLHKESKFGIVVDNAPNALL